VDAVRVDARVADVQAEWLGELAQLAVDVLPLAHSQIVEELGLAEPAEGAGPEFALLVFEVVPEIEQGEKVARGVGELGVMLVGLLAAFERALAGS
jgi:hypothetical protein